MSPFSPSLKKTYSLLLSHSLKSVLLSHYLAFSLDASLTYPITQIFFCTHSHTLTLSSTIIFRHYLALSLNELTYSATHSLSLTLSRTHALTQLLGMDALKYFLFLFLLSKETGLVGQRASFHFYQNSAEIL